MTEPLLGGLPVLQPSVGEAQGVWKAFGETQDYAMSPSIFALVSVMGWSGATAPGNLPWWLF